MDIGMMLKTKLLFVDHVEMNVYPVPPMKIVSLVEVLELMLHIVLALMVHMMTDISVNHVTLDVLDVLIIQKTVLNV